MSKSPDAFRTISEVADLIAVPAHVLRFWESKFSQIRPVKRGGGRRYYRPEDINLLIAIRELLYTEGMTIRGVQKQLKDQGSKSLIARYTPKDPVEAAQEPLTPTHDTVTDDIGDDLDEELWNDVPAEGLHESAMGDITEPLSMDMAQDVGASTPNEDVIAVVDVEDEPAPHVETVTYPDAEPVPDQDTLPALSPEKAAALSRIIGQLQELRDRIQSEVTQEQ